MKEIRADTLDEVFDWVNTYTEDFFFRGVSRAERVLVPRVGRHAEKRTPEEVKAAEEALVTHFGAARGPSCLKL